MNKTSQFQQAINNLSNHYELVGSPILIVDGEFFRVLASNSSCHILTGYSAEELKDRKFEDLFVSGDPRVDAISSILSVSKSTTEIEEHDLPIRKKSGRTIPAIFNVKTRFENGKRICICSISDLSKIRALESEREDMVRKVTYASKLADIGRLAAGVAHEINNPLMIIQGHSDCLVKLIDSPQIDVAGAKNSVDAIVLSTKRMATIIRQMTRVSRNTDLEIQSVSFDEVLDSVLLIMASQLEYNDIMVSVKKERDLIINADEKQIVQIVLNLFSNAVHALENKQGERLIEITMKEEANRSRITFWNNGPKIPNEVRDKLMTPFFTTKSVGKGTGLGLYVSQGIMRAHGGDLFADRIDEGCSFTIQFPFEKVVSTMHREINSSLVVEDEPDLRAFMVETLKKRGLRVLEAKNGIEALKILQVHQDIGLVVTDIRMPEMDGIEFIRNLNFSCPEVRVLVVSGFVPEYEVELSSLRIEGRFNKPIDQKDFALTLDRMLEHKLAS